MNVVRQAWASLRLMIVLTVVLGVLYPLAGVAVGQVVGGRADGSLLTVDGTVVGSELIGQRFEGDQWFIPRPSAAGDGYDAMASAGSNLGPNSQRLVSEITARKAQVAAREGVDPAAVPADAVTASGSGLDPAISAEYAALQVPRVARVRGLSEEQVRVLVGRATTGRGFGFLGDATVNVVALNLSLEQAE